MKLLQLIWVSTGHSRVKCIKLQEAQLQFFICRSLLEANMLEVIPSEVYIKGKGQTVAILRQTVYCWLDFMLSRTLLFPAEISAQKHGQIFTRS
jgi:hypothetical protein